MGSIFNPADMLYNFFGKKPKELKRLKEMKKDDTVRNLLETKFDRETISVLLCGQKRNSRNTRTLQLLRILCQKSQ